MYFPWSVSFINSSPGTLVSTSYRSPKAWTTEQFIHKDLFEFSRKFDTVWPVLIVRLGWYFFYPLLSKQPDSSHTRIPVTPCTNLYHRLFCVIDIQENIYLKELLHLQYKEIKLLHP